MTFESSADAERTADQVLADLIGWFQERRLAAREQELTRQLRISNEGYEDLLAQKDAALRERRARLGVLKNEPGPASGSGHATRRSERLE